MITIDKETTRVEKLRKYLLKIINDYSRDYKINVNWLSKNVNNYSLDRIPASSEVEKWITGLEIHRDVYSFKSRNKYTEEMADNLKNIGFFESFEETIKYNNNNKILPDITGIKKIECLNTGSMVRADNTNTAEFDIQIQITYLVNR